MKKETLLVEVTNVNNYGTMLQAYALQRTLTDVLDMNAPIVDCQYRNMLKQSFRLFNRKLVCQKEKMFKLIYILKKNEAYWKYWTSRNMMFDKFRDEDLYFTKLIKSRRQLLDEVNGVKFVVLGSDQVWNPINLGRDYYTLSFVPDNVRKIAYAPSFGVAVIPRYQRKKTKSYLKRIECLSVREKTGQRIIKDLSGRQAQVVCDPTILLEKAKWEEFERKVDVLPTYYILCYFLGNLEEARDAALELKKETGYPIVHLPFLEEYVKRDEEFGDIMIDGIGPREFIYLIHHAQVICTDSFHGTVFSIIFHKEFYCFSRDVKDCNSSTQSRISDLLEETDLSSRIGYKTRIQIHEQEYENVDCSINKLRESSLNYLRTSLEE